jgi:HEAT repeat protein
VGVGTNTPLRPPPPPDGQLDLAAIRAIRRRKDTASLLGLFSRDDVQASAKLRRSIVMGLALSRDPESVQTIVGLAEHDPDHKVRLRAMAGLRTLGDRSTVPFLAHTLEHTPNVAIKLHAIGALANTFANDAVRPLIKALEDPSAIVRTASADALVQLGDPAAVSAIEATRRRAWNPYVRVSLSHALRRLQTSA